MAAESAVLPLNAFWYGAELTPLAAACLHSFVELGHPVTLHVYDAVGGVPKSVTLADASKILPREAFFIHRESGTATPFSDHFRYVILARGLGAWIDCDMLGLRRVDNAPCIFGFEAESSINGAILRLPPDSPVLADLLAIFTTPRWVPPWYSLPRRLRYKLKYAFSSGYDYRSLNWGAIGPQAVSYFIHKGDLDRAAAPREVFYPVGYRDAEVLFESPEAVGRHLTPQSRCIHLWNSRLSRTFKAKPIDKGSFIARILDGTWRAALSL